MPHMLVRMAEAPAQPKPMEVTRTSHPCGHHRKHKSFKAAPSLTESKCKIEMKKITKMKS
jgi:hypothetical protein